MDPGSPPNWAFIILAIALGGCTPDCTPESGPVRPNVVLVTVDTLRADHLGCYGNSVVRTPEIDRLAAEGALFEICYAPTNATVPSHLAIFSSLPLAEHGVLSNAGEPARSVELLPQVFARAGYRTAAVVSAKHVGPEFGLGSVLTNLELYDAPRRISVPSRAEETNQRVFRWLRGACGDPFFLWIHYWDPHMPYAPTRPFDRAYYQGDPHDPAHTSMSDVELPWRFYDLSGLRQVLAPHALELEALQEELGLSWRELRELILGRGQLRAHGDGRSAEADLRRRLDILASFIREHAPLRRRLADWLTGVRDLDFPRAQYAGEVSYVDRHIGELHAELQSLGIAGRTILIVTADHGESLGEHGIYFGHAGLYDQSLRVPLIMWAPGRVTPGRHTEVVRSLDIAPTVLTLANLQVPPAMEGRDLFDVPRSRGPVVSEGSYGGRQVMLLDGRWKLIRTRKSFQYTESFAPEAGTTELYDIRNDKDEENDLAGVRPEIVQALGKRLDTWLAARPRSRDGTGVRSEVDRTTTVSRERLEALRALGYAE